jgi:hypothetical protein
VLRKYFFERKSNMKSCRLGMAMAMTIFFLIGSAPTQADIGTAFTYQGRLTDNAGSPLTGAYDFQFSLYDAVSGGSQVGSTVPQNNISVTQGFFTAVLDFGPGRFAGDPRWLEIGVRPHNMGSFAVLSPRQPLTPVPYALYAASTPGGTGGGDITGVYGNSGITGGGSSGEVTLSADTNYLQRRVSGTCTGTNAIQIINSDGTVSCVSTGGGGLTLPYAGTTSGSPGFSVTGTTGTIAIRGLATNTGAITNYGGYFEAYGSTGRGVAGVVNGSGAYGVYGFATGNAIRGVHGEGPTGVYGLSTSGTSTGGLYGVSTASNGNGIIGEANTGSSAYGIWGKSTEGTAGYFRGKKGIHSVSDSGFPAGLFEGKVSIGTTSTDTDHILLVNGLARFDVGGGQFRVSTPGGWPGLIMFSPLGHRRDLHILDDSIAISVGSSGSAPTLGNGIRIYENGHTVTKVLEITGGADFSENFDIRGFGKVSAPAPGMVVSIDPNEPGKLIVSDKAYDRKVAGIISGAGGVKPGMIMGQEGTEAHGSSPVALSGRVYCWADASQGAIEPGDLLTSSDVPGHAMKVGDYAKAQGAVIGKAMTSLKEGTGLVLVLVALQ